MLMKYRLFTPGPTSVPEATLLELAKPVHHHRTGEFRAMFNEVQDLLKGTEVAGQGDRQAEVDSEAEDEADAALALTEQGEDDAIAENLRNRLDAIERALRRLDEGTYGRSVRSGEPIPDERLEADPAAELTIEEARAAERR